MKILEFGSRAEASAAAADFLAGRLRARLATGEAAALMVSGGSTPLDCLAALSRMPLDWRRVTVLPTDERCVPRGHKDSNAGMIRRQLKRGEAREVGLAGLAKASDLRGLRPGETKQVSLVNLAEGTVAPLAGQLVCALIGMGEDGHFASIFPDGEGLDSLLALDAEPGVAKISTAASQHERITANLALLLAGEAALLLAFGEAKKRILLQPGSRPVAALLQQRQCPVTVHWAP